MSEKKGWGKSVLGWFVVQEETESVDSVSPPSPVRAGGAAELSADDLIAKYANEGAPPARTGGGEAESTDSVSS